MKFWFLENQQRLAHERNAIHELESTAEWLEGIEWNIDSKGLSFNATIIVNGKPYRIKVTYPVLYPFAPPEVRPENPEDLWSEHQYSNGTLCLEWGPDNWHQEITAAQMLESAYRLLQIENPVGSDSNQKAPSRHFLTQGQLLRNKFLRFYASGELMAYLTCLPKMTKGVLDFSIQIQKESLLAIILKLDPFEGRPGWSDASIPEALKNPANIKAGLFFKTALDSSIIERIKEVKDIEMVLERAGFGAIHILEEDFYRSMRIDKEPSCIFLLDENDVPYFFKIFSSSEAKIYRFIPVYSGDSDPLSRIPPELDALSRKSFGIVGLGSVGGRLALSLARMGVRNFYLVDEDIFLPENICRHVLDWRNVGEHKVDAITNSLDYIAPDMKVNVSRLNLTGQESTSGLSVVLSRLGNCDIIIDATANSRVFNLLSALAVTYSKPFVWAEIYAGGIGGMIARSRPGYDPDPQTMRSAYLSYVSENPDPELQVNGPYSAEDTEGNVFLAADAEVGVITYFATRFAVDTVLEREPSLFPHSLYLIGLNRSWIFKAPFHTIPIATDHLTKIHPHEEVNPEVVADNVDF